MDTQVRVDQCYFVLISFTKIMKDRRKSNSQPEKFDEEDALFFIVEYLNELIYEKFL